MGYKMNSTIPDLLGINEELSTYDVPVFEKNMPEKVWGTANMDKTIHINKVSRYLSKNNNNIFRIKFLLNKFPNSKYSQDSTDRMTYLMNKIAEYDLHVARYYMIRKAYVAALNRAQYVLQEFPQTIHQEEALIIMISAYEFLGIKDLQADTEKILKLNYPESKFHTKDLQAQKKKWWHIWDSLYD